jgi:hypothetical protein
MALIPDCLADEVDEESASELFESYCDDLKGLQESKDELVPPDINIEDASRYMCQAFLLSNLCECDKWHTIEVPSKLVALMRDFLDQLVDEDGECYVDIAEKKT